MKQKSNPKKKSVKPKSWLFEKTNEVYIPAVRLGKKLQVSGMIDYHLVFIHIKKIIRECCKQLHAHIFNNLDETNSLQDWIFQRQSRQPYVYEKD